MKKRRAITSSVKRAVWDKCSGRCWYCGKHVIPPFFHYDHFHPHSKGGKDTVENLVVACISCNSSKSDSEVALWRVRIQRKSGLALSRRFIKQLLCKGIDPSEDPYTWEPPVVFYFERNLPEEKLFGDFRNVKFVKFGGWSE